MALRAFAKARRQLFPIDVVLVKSRTTETTERAKSVGVGMAWMSEVAPAAAGRIDPSVVSQVAVFCLISTTIQGGAEHRIGRGSRLRTVPQLSLLAVMRHTLPFGIVNPFNNA